MTDEGWKRYKDDINRKTGTKCKVSRKVSPSGELIIRNLSSTVSGKAQNIGGLAPGSTFHSSTMNYPSKTSRQLVNFPALKESDLEWDISIFYDFREGNWKHSGVTVTYVIV